MKSGKQPSHTHTPMHIRNIQNNIPNYCLAFLFCYIQLNECVFAGREWEMFINKISVCVSVFRFVFTCGRKILTFLYACAKFWAYCVCANDGKYTPSIHIQIAVVTPPLVGPFHFYSRTRSRIYFFSLHCASSIDVCHFFWPILLARVVSFPCCRCSAQAACLSLQCACTQVHQIFLLLLAFVFHRFAVPPECCIYKSISIFHGCCRLVLFRSLFVFIILIKTELKNERDATGTERERERRKREADTINPNHDQNTNSSFISYTTLSEVLCSALLRFASPCLAVCASAFCYDEKCDNFLFCNTQLLFFYRLMISRNQWANEKKASVRYQAVRARQRKGKLDGKTNANIEFRLIFYMQDMPRTEWKK